MKGKLIDTGHPHFRFIEMASGINPNKEIEIIGRNLIDIGVCRIKQGEKVCEVPNSLVKQT